MSDQKPKKKTQDSMSILSGNAAGYVPEKMPQPDVRTLLPMRDGVRLDTNVWLPKSAAGPVPTILLRTPYIEEVMGWARLGALRYVEASYALVIQVIRGVPPSEGTFTMSSPFERTDGYDTIAWVASQSWSSGAVGMDGSSYVGMTQLFAAATRPPALKAIAVHVPTIHKFREIPYFGGIFSRMHTINWTNLISIKSLAELTGGFVSLMPLISKPEWLERMFSRPLIDAADDLLKGDKLGYYKDALTHSTLDDWWRARMLRPAEFAAMDLPMLVVSGNFDLSIGALEAWRQLEANTPNPAQRNLLIGPWDHGQSYIGGGDSHGPYEFDGQATLDLHATRLAFFDRHLKGQGSGPDLGGRVKLYITGENAWHYFTSFPPEEVTTQALYISSAGHANSRRGDGILTSSAPSKDEPADHFVTDPNWPFIGPLVEADKARLFQVREREDHSETLVYTSEPLAEPLTLLGEAEAVLHVACNQLDADVWVWLVEATADGRSIGLGNGGGLRLRYREGFDREVLLTPGEPVEARIKLTYIGHRVAAGSRLRLMISGTNFPWGDPNPHTGGPIATETKLLVAEQSVLHGKLYPSRIELPVLKG